MRLDLSEKNKKFGVRKTAETRQQDKKQSYLVLHKKEPLSIAVGVVQHRRGRHCWSVGAARGRERGGCEAVGTGADSQCLQRGAFSLEGGDLFHVYLRCGML